MVSTSDFGPRGPGLEYNWRNHAHNRTALNCTEAFIITRPLSRYALSKVERGVNTKSSSSATFNKGDNL